MILKTHIRLVKTSYIKFMLKVEAIRKASRQVVFTNVDEKVLQVQTSSLYNIHFYHYKEGHIRVKRPKRGADVPKEPEN